MIKKTMSDGRRYYFRNAAEVRAMERWSRAILALENIGPDLQALHSDLKEWNRLARPFAGERRNLQEIMEQLRAQKEGLA